MLLKNKDSLLFSDIPPLKFSFMTIAILFSSIQPSKPS
jgi:hypothetical protein